MSEPSLVSAALPQLLSALSVLQDPRDPRARLHTLSDVLAITVLAVTRQDARTDAGSTERRYYISSSALGAEQAACAVRAHWLIENQLHWVLDMSFGQDACTVRTRNAAHLLRRGHDKRSLRMRMRRCDWDRGYREQLLRGQA